jgi:threonine dehydrogenase-like Zn-dependent dehydrogenase
MKRVLALHGQPTVVELDEPELRTGEVLVETDYSTVSTGTEQLILRHSLTSPGSDDEYPGSEPSWPKIRDGQEPLTLPRPPISGYASLGYSAAGTVRAVGPGVGDLRPGDRVACSGSQCAHHAEVIAVPRNLATPVPDGLGTREAAFVTLGSVAMESLRKADVRFGETVVIYGLGVLGLLAAQIAQASGLYVVGLDIDENRRALADQIGLTAVGHPDEADSMVAGATHGFGADAVLVGVVSESDRPFNHALELVRQRGTVIVLGVFGMSVDRAGLGRNDATVKQTIAYGPGRYDPHYEEGGADYPIGLVRWTENRNMQHFLRLVAEGRVDVLSLTTPEAFAVDDATSAYAQLQRDPKPPTVQFAYSH